MQNLVNDYIEMNKAGLVLELCEKYYDANVTMLSNGSLFANSMNEAFEKQKGFVEMVKEFDVTLISKKITDNISELVFHYKMTGADSKTTEYTGKHIQTWENQRIVREEYQTVE